MFIIIFGQLRFLLPHRCAWLLCPTLAQNQNTNVTAESRDQVYRPFRGSRHTALRSRAQNSIKTWLEQQCALRRSLYCPLILFLSIFADMYILYNELLNSSIDFYIYSGFLSILSIRFSKVFYSLIFHF